MNVIGGGAMDKNAPIGLFDSGIGGLTVVKAMKKILPNENIIYVGDNKRAPYGPRSPVQIVEFMHEIFKFFLTKKVKMAVFACNTMTAYGYEEAKKNYPFLITAMNTGAQQALQSSINKKIGVIATQGAITSKMHEKAIAQINQEADVYAVACHDFVPLIEKGDFVGTKIKEVAKKYLQPLKEKEIKSLILGCTHYPLISSVINEILGSEITLINPAEATAADAKELLRVHNLLKTTQCAGTTEIYFSAELEKSKKLSQMILNNNTDLYKTVEL